MIKESSYLQAIQTGLHGAGLPYGYAITVWSTGAALSGQHGMPSLSAIYLFAVGAVTAYGGLTLLTADTAGEAQTQLTRSPRPLRAGLIHVAAIALAITAAALIAEISGGFVWLLAPLVATLTYLAVSSIEVALVEEKRDSPEAGG